MLRISLRSLAILTFFGFAPGVIAVLPSLKTCTEKCTAAMDCVDASFCKRCINYAQQTNNNCLKSRIQDALIRCGTADETAEEEDEQAKPPLTFEEELQERIAQKHPEYVTPTHPAKAGPSRVPAQEKLTQPSASLRQGTCKGLCEQEKIRRIAEIINEPCISDIAEVVSHKAKISPEPPLRKGQSGTHGSAFEDELKARLAKRRQQLKEKYPDQEDLWN